jgi:hypothetical protein
MNLECIRIYQNKSGLEVEIGLNGRGHMRVISERESTEFGH